MERTRLDACRDGAAFAADVCVIGSGPAGATIAAELATSRLSTLVVESGGRDVDPSLVALDEIESVGAPRVADPSKLIARAVGGSSHAWNGRCVAFEPIDFAPRDWVPGSGWPITPDALRPFLDRAAARLRLGPNVYDDALWPLLGLPRPTPALDPARLATAFWQYAHDPADRGRYFNFRDVVDAIGSPDVRLLTGATVTHLNADADADGRAIASAEIADGRGRRFTVGARAFVLCAGGIQNARLMLASNRVVPAGVGNARDRVGRYLMDHPRCTIGHFASRDVGRVLSRFGLYQLRDAAGTHPYSLGVALAPDLQRDERLLNAAAWLTERRAADDPWDAIRRLTSRGNDDDDRPRGRRGMSRLRDAVAVASHPALLARGAYRVLVSRRGVVHKIDRLMLDAIVEQRPDPDSRLTLSTTRRDRFGVPLPRVDWRIGEQERRTVARFGQTIAAELTRAGLPAPTLVDWVRDGAIDGATFRDVAHPTGTTRMSRDPADGVVDVDGRVHGVAGLYVAGSSVFPTAGHGNPTLMLVALATRLADHLRATL